MVQGRCDYSIDAIPVNGKLYGTLMCICADEGAIYVTKEQAKEFFGLVDKKQLEACQKLLDRYARHKYEGGL